MAISDDKLNNYSDEFISILDDKIEYIKSIIEKLDKREKPTYGYVPKKSYNHLLGSKKYNRELDTLLLIKSIYNEFLNYSLEPFAFFDESLESIECLVSCLDDDEKKEFTDLLCADIGKINDKKLKALTELKIKLLSFIGDQKHFNFGQDKLKDENGKKITMDDLVNLEENSKLDAFKKAEKINYNFGGREIPLGTYDAYEIVSKIDENIKNGKYDNVGDINYDELKQDIISLERVINCNKYAVLTLSTLGSYGPNSFKDTISYLKKLVLNHYKKYVELNTKIGQFNVEDLINETEKIGFDDDKIELN